MKQPLVAILDDEKSLVDLMKQMFGIHGISTVYIASKDDVIGQLNNMAVLPDIIIMSYRMPSTNGIKATRSILQRYPRMKIIFLTVDTGIRDEALKAGATTVLNNSVALYDIVKIINGLTQ